MARKGKKGQPTLGKEEQLMGLYAETKDLHALGLLADWVDEFEPHRGAFAGRLRAETAAKDWKDVWFFYKHAACSYDPAKESKLEGYLRGARMYADAEAWLAGRDDLAPDWHPDEFADRSWMGGEGGPEGGDDDRTLWGCSIVRGVMPWMIGRDMRRHNRVWASCGGIDLGPDGYPDGPGRDPYSRVMEAELAMEARDFADENVNEVCLHNRRGAKRWVTVYSLAEAAECVLWWAREGNIDSHTWGSQGGEVRKPGGKVFAHVSPNGRVWEGGNRSHMGKELLHQPG